MRRHSGESRNPVLENGHAPDELSGYKNNIFSEVRKMLNSARGLFALIPYFQPI